MQAKEIVKYIKQCNETAQKLIISNGLALITEMQTVTVVMEEILRFVAWIVSARLRTVILLVRRSLGVEDLKLSFHRTKAKSTTALTLTLSHSWLGRKERFQAAIQRLESPSTTGTVINHSSKALYIPLRGLYLPLPQFVRSFYTSPRLSYSSIGRLLQ